MSKGKAVAVPALIAVVAVASGGWFLQRDIGLGANLYVQARVLEEVMNRIERHFVDEVDVEELYDAALERVVESLGDPNSALLQAPDWEDMQIRTRGEYGGVGLEVVKQDSFVTNRGPGSGHAWGRGRDFGPGIASSRSRTGRSWDGTPTRLRRS